MIGSLRGTLIGKTDLDSSQILIEVDGVGYRVILGKNTITDLSPIGSETTVYVSHQVREDSETLYGFIDLKDRDTFELLLKIHKVGPSMALEILDNFNLEQLQGIVLKKDLDSLTNISGIGKTTAERLLNELKNKLDISDIAFEEVPTTTSDARKALLELGYSNSEIREVFQEMPQKLETQEIIRQALLRLSKK